MSLWLVRHRLVFKRLLIGGLIGVSVALHATAVLTVIGLARGRAAHQTMLEEFTRPLTDYPALHAKMAAQPLQISLVHVLPSGTSRADLAVRVVNPNQRFAVTSLGYHFWAGTEEIAGGSGFLLPGEQKYFWSFGVAGVGATPSVTLSDVAWSRVIPEEYASWRDRRLRISVNGIRHQRGAELGLGAAAVGALTRFTVMNDSLYGVWDVGLYLLLLNGDQLVAGQFTRVRQMEPYSRQEIMVTWAQRLPLHTHVVVVPELNPFDEQSFYDYRVPEAGPR